VIVGNNNADDAAVFRLNGGNAIVQSVDFFTPVVDDPFDFGRIAAVNSLSDLYAMGVSPLFALNIVSFPASKLPLEILTDILKGGSWVAERCGIPILGGHSIDDPEPKYGWVVTGMVQEKDAVMNSNAKAGDILVLTKHLGSGVLTTGIKRGLTSQEGERKIIDLMVHPNKNASEIMIEVGVNACTDITGYGLLGHLFEMVEASGVSAHIEWDNIPILYEAVELAEQGIFPGGTKRNFKHIQDSVEFRGDLTTFEQLLLADAQTSGGLLISIPEKNLQIFLEKMKEKKEFTSVIGRIISREKYPIIVT
jgi:selenide,water dikinase